MLKRILKITGITLAVLIVFALLAPFLFRKQLVASLKSEMNRQLTATVDFDDLSLSFIRRFPRVSVAVENLRIVGKNEFAGDTLLQARRIETTLDFWSVVKAENFRIYTVEADEPRVHALVNGEGKANWDILPPDTSSTKPGSTAPFRLELKRYAIHNASIRYTDEQAGISTRLQGLDHEGSGNFDAEKFTLKTSTKAGALTVRHGAIPWLSDVKTTVEADLEIDNRTNTYTLREGKVSINELRLQTNGSVQLVNDSTYKLDLTLKAPSTDFREVLSLIPALYRHDFNKIKTSGKARFEGFVKGIYGPAQLPAFNLVLDVRDGFFQYPDLPKPMRDIQLDLRIENPDGVPDHTALLLNRARCNFDGEPIEARMSLQRPMSTQLIDASVKGRLDLARTGQMVKLDTGTQLRGVALADVQLKGSVAALQQKRYDGFLASGSLRLNDFFYASREYPAGLAFSKLLATFNPRNITLSDLTGRYGKSNFTATGALNNLPAYLLKGDALNGNLSIRADQLNLNEFIPVTSDTSAAPATPPFAVPANINFTLNAEADRVHYDKLDLEQLSGSLAIREETVFMRDLKARALGGNVKINGTYSTLADKKRPDISLSYDVQNLDVRQTFLAFNTVQKLMPIARYMGGRLTSQLSLTGKLGNGMMPDFNSLNGKGNLLLLDGVLERFAPVDRLANLLQISQLQKLSLRELRNYFEFANGKVLVKPFTVKAADVEVEAGGLHGFDQSLDYVLNVKAPRAKLGNGANTLVNNLAAQASAKGVPVRLGETVNLKVNMGGTISDPKLRTSLKESGQSLAEDLKQQAASFVQNKIDSSKKLLIDTLKATRDQLVQDAKNQVVNTLTGNRDSSGQSKPLNAEEIKKKAENTGRGLIRGILGKKEPPKDTASGN